MSRRTSTDPLALSSAGTVFVNVAMFDGVETPAEILDRALAEPGDLFVGVALSQEDLENVRPRITSACREAAAFVIGRRQRAARRRSR